MRFAPLLSALVLAGLVGACTPQPRSLALSDGALDTFEDGNTASTIGTQWEGVAEGDPASTVSVTLQRGGFATIAYALAVTGFRSDAATAQTTTGVRLPLTRGTRAEGEDITSDARGFSGLALALKGRPGTYIVQIGSSRIKDFNYYNAYVEVSENWTEFKIPFSGFKQESFGAQVPWTGDELSFIAIYTSQAGDLSFGIDDLRFY